MGSITCGGALHMAEFALPSKACSAKALMGGRPSFNAL